MICVGTYRFFVSLMSKYGIESDFIDLTNTSLLEKTIKPNTKVRSAYWAMSTSNMCVMCDVCVCVICADDMG